MPKTAGLETTYEEEHDFVASHFRSAFLNRSGELLGQESVRRALLWLSQSGEHRLAFVADPDGCLAQQGLELTGLQRLFVAHFVEVYPPDRPESASLYGRLFRAQLKS